MDIAGAEIAAGAMNAIVSVHCLFGIDAMDRNLGTTLGKPVTQTGKSGDLAACFE